MTPILAIDPGPKQSAAAVFDGNTILTYTEVNESMLRLLRDWIMAESRLPLLVVEMIASYGMAVGKEVFETCYWIGRFVEAWPGESKRLTRLEVKMHLCHDARATDSNVRRVLLDRFGPKGTVKNPGPCYGIKDDEWQALAVAATAWDKGLGNGTP